MGQTIWEKTILEKKTTLETDEVMADEVDEADFDASNEVDNDGIDGVVEERPAPMSPKSSISAMSNHA